MLDFSLWKKHAARGIHGEGDQGKAGRAPSQKKDTLIHKPARCNKGNNTRKNKTYNFSEELKKLKSLTQKLQKLTFKLLQREPDRPSS